MGNNNEPTDRLSSRFSDDQVGSGISRRRMLTGASGIAACGLAGCLGTDDDNSNGSGNGENGNSNGSGNGENGNEPRDPVIDMLNPQDGATEMDFNNYAPTYPSALMRLIGESAGWPVLGGETIYWGAEESNWDSETNTFSLTIRDDLNHANGDPLNAIDVQIYEEMQRLMNPEGSSYESVNVVDDYTVEYVYKEPQNEQFVENGLVSTHRLTNKHRDLWTSWLEKLQDATTDDEVDNIVTNLSDWSIGIDEYMEAGYASGAYDIIDYGDVTIDLELRDNYFAADQVNIERVTAHNVSGAAMDEMVLNQELDLNAGLLPARYQGSVPEGTKNVVEYPDTWMMHVAFNFHHEDLQDINVRRAMAAVINTDNVVTNVGYGEPIDVHSGVDPTANEDFLGDTTEDYIDYSPRETDFDKADEYLERSDYSREDGTIYRPNGEEMDEIGLLVYTGDQWFIPAETASRQLGDYGFPMDLLALDRSTQWTRMGEADYDMVVESHYSSSGHPLEFFRPDHHYGYQLEANMSEARTNIPQWLDNGIEFSEFNGAPLNPEIPVAIGQEDLSGETMRINPFDYYTQIDSGEASEERTVEIIQDLSWMWNFLMPGIDLHVKTSGCWGNTTDFDWSNVTDNSMYELQRMAHLAPLFTGDLDYVYE